MVKYPLFVIIFALIISPCTFAQKNKDYREYIEQLDFILTEQAAMREFKQQQDTEYRKFLRQEQEAYRKYVEEVEKKWNEFIGSTRQLWVDYSASKDARSIVNFEEEEVTTARLGGQYHIRNANMVVGIDGSFAFLFPYPASFYSASFAVAKEKRKTTPANRGQIVIEAVVPASTPDAENKAKEMIGNQVEKLFSADNEAKANVLEGQVKNKKGEVVTAQNARKFADEEVLPKARSAPGPIKSKDGVQRIKVSATVAMVPDHIRVRAEQYLPSARKYCNQYGEDLPLTMAIIQTESYFNPLAQSPIPAYGLMQLSPNADARDAYKYVFKEDKPPLPSYLYVPDNNMMLGVAYLHMLRENYFYGVRDPKKQEYLVIAACNAGVEKVVKQVLKKYDIPSMPPSGVYNVLKQEMPDETKDYLAKVTARKNIYSAWQQDRLKTTNITDYWDRMASMPFPEFQDERARVAVFWHELKDSL